MGDRTGLLQLGVSGDDAESWWRQGAIYQIYPRSFQDSSGDGVGDLEGVIRRMPYLQALGISAIWLSPFFRSPMKDFGYDVQDHRDVDPMFGSLESFDRLIAAAHEAGIRIMIDLVLSHASDQHPWFVSARQGHGAEHEDCFVWAEPNAEGEPPNNWLSVFGGPAWTFEPKRKQYYLHNFLTSQPDLNFHHPRVQDEALDVARFWLDRGVDGFRLDTVNFYFHDQQLRDNPAAAARDNQVVSSSNPYSHQEHVYDKNQPEVPGFLERLRCLLDKYPGAIALGEVGASDTRARELMRTYQSPGRLHLSYTFDLLSCDFTAASFREHFERDAEEAGTLWRCVSFSNHDVKRTASRVARRQRDPRERAGLALALLLTMRGTPCIYQGEELGLTEAEIPYDRLVDPYGIAFWPEFKGRDGCRTPMPWAEHEAHAGFSSSESEPWLPIPPEHKEKAVDTQEGVPDSMLSLTRELLELRHSSRALSSERQVVLNSSDELLVFERGTADQRLLCIFNLSDDAIEYGVEQDWRDATRLCGSRASSGSIITETVRLAADGWLILGLGAHS